jgi:hypothetical protein
MANQPGGEPPKIRIAENGRPDIGSLADLLEWFLNYDERTARIRHVDTEQVFQWKQQDDKVNGVNVYPFENAEARFAIGAIQAIDANPTEEELQNWITNLLEAIQESHKTKAELTDAYRLNDDLDASTIERSNKLPSNLEKRLYLSSCWMETLYTAEVRYLGWVFQELYGHSYAA